jgi:nucleotide-binding universal stress UspA family protein
MYKRILVALENSPYDQAILLHIAPLAELCGAQLTLVHVADGFAARYQEVLNLADSEEIRADRIYLEECKARFTAQGLHADAYLAGGEPARKLVELAEELGCDLIAMATHGHKGLADVVLGSVADAVRHSTSVPVLLVRGNREGEGRVRE